MLTKIVLDDRGKEAAAAQLVDRKVISLSDNDKRVHDDGYARSCTIVFNGSTRWHSTYSFPPLPPAVSFSGSVLSPSQLDSLRNKLPWPLTEFPDFHAFNCVPVRTPPPRTPGVTAEALLINAGFRDSPAGIPNPREFEKKCFLEPTSGSH